MNGRIYTPGCQSGAISIITVVLLSTVVVVLLLGTITQGRSGISDAVDSVDAVKALFLAESGLENSIQRLSSVTSLCDVSLASSISAQGGVINIASGVNTSFDNVTPLPAGQCRVSVEALMASQVRRHIQAIVAYGGAGGIAVDNAGSRERRNQDFVNYNFSVAGSNRFLLVAVIVYTAAGETVTAVNYAGTDLPLLGAVATADASLLLQLHYMVAPPLGGNALQVNVSNRTNFVVGAIGLTGVHQGTPIETIGAGNFVSGSSNAPVLTVNTATDSTWVVDVMGTILQTATPTAGALQSIQWSLRNNGGSNRVWASSSSQGPVSPGAVTMQWNWSGAGAPWVLGAVVLRPADGAGGVLAWRESPP